MSWVDFRLLFLLFCVVLSGFFLGMLVHELFHGFFGGSFEVCIGVNESVPAFAALMYSYNATPSNHFSHSEVIAWGLTFGVLFFWLYLAGKFKVFN